MQAISIGPEIMRLEPLNSGTTTARTPFIPPSTRGLDESKPLRSLKPDNAARLINMISDLKGLRSRPGQRRWVLGLPGRVDSMANWAGDHKFAFSGGYCYRFQHGVSTRVFGPNYSDRWWSETVSNQGAKILVVTSDLDGVMNYDGKVWRVSNITGVEPIRLICPTYYGRHLFFACLRSQTIYHLAPGAVSGPAYALPLAGAFGTEAPIISLAVVKGMDDAKNPSDQLAVITADGEVLVLEGTNPARAETWGQVGMYSTGQPMGWRPAAQVGGQVYLITKIGIASLPATLPKPLSDRQKSTISTPIQTTYAKWSPLINANGWQIVEHSAGQGGVILNWPDQSPHMLVNGSWSESLGIKSTCWMECNGQTFRGTANGEVWQYGVGSDDDGLAIDCIVQSAYTHNGARTTLARARPLLQAARGMKPYISALTNYADLPPEFRSPYPFRPIKEDWKLDWDARSALLQNLPVQNEWDWYGINGGSGHAISIVFAAQTRSELYYQGCDLMSKSGGQS